MTPLFTALWLFTACSLLPSTDHDEHGDHDDHGDHHDGPREVHLSPEAVAAARIVSAEAVEGPLQDTLALPARVTLDPRREAVVSAWIAGQIDTINVRAGDAVTRNQRLAQVQSPELGEAVAAFRTATARDKAADARLERLKRLEADGVTSKAQVLEADADHAEAEGEMEAAEERLRILGVPMTAVNPHDGEHFPSRVPVRSPIAGVVLTASASVGQRVGQGDALFHVGDLDEVWLLLDVYERDLAAVAEGQTVRFSVAAWPEVPFVGTVAQVGDWVEPDARTVEVRVVVDNPDHKLKPNMFATAHLTTSRGSSEVGVLVPPTALQTIDGVETVFVETGAGEYSARPVKVAARGRHQLRLSAGVSAGERIVVDGAFALMSELEKGELGGGHDH